MDNDNNDNNKNNSKQDDSGSRTRVVIFGIDGATWEIIKMMLKENKLNNFKKIITNGVYGNLRSVIPPVTCPAWATMMTGKNPATLGVFYFLKPDMNYDRNVSPLGWVKWRPIWDILSEHDKKVCVFNVPTTMAGKVNGYFISGPIWGDDYQVLAYPESLKRRLKNEGYSIAPETKAKVHGDKIFIEDVFKTTKKQFKIMFDYFLNFDWDLFIMSLNSGDTLQHYYWKNMDKRHPKFSANSKNNRVIFDYFELMDEYLGRILNGLPKSTNIFIVSDHGQKIAYSYVNLNAWLYKNGFLKMKQNYHLKKDGTVNRFLKTNFLKAVYFISKSYAQLIHHYNLIRKPFFRNFQNRLKTSTYVIEKKILTNYPLKRYTDWENTKAYSLAHNTIYINLKERQSKGIVTKKDYNKVRSAIILELKKLTYPKTDQKVIKNVWLKEEIYPENPREDFPDIYIELDEGFRNYYSDIFDPTEIFSENLTFSTEHRLDGIFLAYGPDIEPGINIKKVRLEDLVPTILHLLKFKIPNDINGRVVTKIFKKDSESGLREVEREIPPETKKSESSRIRKITFSKKI